MCLSSLDAELIVYLPVGADGSRASCLENMKWAGIKELQLESVVLMLGRTFPFTVGFCSQASKQRTTLIESFICRIAL